MITIKKSSSRLVLNRNLASLYYKKGDYRKAADKIKSMLCEIIDKEVLIRKIEKFIDSDSIIDSTIVFSGGEQNIGCILTRTSTKEYFTKLSIGGNREQQFYNDVYPRYLKLFKEKATFISPFIKQVFMNDTNINAIVMTKIKGTKVNIVEKMPEIADLNKLYSSIKYSELTDQYVVEEYNDFILFHPSKPANPITALHSFSSIHIKQANKRLFKQIRKHLKKMKYNESAQVYLRLQELILNEAIYDRINPLVNYSIQHGDFFEHNILQDDKHTYCIDWGCARIGPVALDMAGLLGCAKLPFHTIQQEYLNHARSNHLTKLDKVLFIYILLITWFIVYDKKKLDSIASTDLTNAIKHMEYYIQ